VKILITGGDSRLSRAAGAAFAPEISVRLADHHFGAALPAGVERREGDIREEAFAAECMQGMDCILHLDPLTAQEGEDIEALDRATRGTYVLIEAALNAGVPQFVLGSSLALFDRLPADWAVTENWRPRPEPRIAHLSPWLAELCVRECIRAASIRALCLRFGQIVDEEEARSRPFDPRRLHLEDALAGLHRAVTFTPHPSLPQQGWWVFHITAPGDGAKIRLSNSTRQTLGYEPTHDFDTPGAAAERTQEPARSDPRTWKEILSPAAPVPSRPIRKVVVFGAGGPLAAVTAQELRDAYTLRLTDLRPLEEIAAEAKPQSPGAPLPTPFPPPHACQTVDVRDVEQVMSACEDMDAILNCTVIRHDPVDAFLVNTIGAYNLLQAAVAHGIRRVVQTGPNMVAPHTADGYWWDYDLTSDAPPRPGRSLYGISKYLGQEICRVFAEAYALEIPVLLFCLFVNPETAHPGSLHPFSVSWQDSARALRRALEAPSLPSPYEVMNIHADLPHGLFSNAKARQLLDWEPRDRLEKQWKRPIS
jgi:nucleoside-diphosphate-sugar epimerase